MKKSTAKLLSAKERDLVRAARPKRLARLDEDELLALHRRVRRARNKYSLLHRRQARSQVGVEGGRGAASKKNRGTLAKAEVFEGVLESVSDALARAAAESSARLREERLELARSRRGGGAGGRSADVGMGAGAVNRRTADTSPRDMKISAHRASSGKRRQAARDGRN